MFKQKIREKIINRAYVKLYKQYTERELTVEFVDEFFQWFDCNKRFFSFDLLGISLGCYNILDYFGVGFNETGKCYALIEMHDKNFSKRSWKFIVTILSRKIKVEVYSSYTDFNGEYKYNTSYDKVLKNSYGTNRIINHAVHSIITYCIIEYVKFKVEQEGKKLHEAIPTFSSGE